jgi:hypothetical protein
VPSDDYVVSNRRIGKIVSLYQRELFKKIPRLGTFCTQYVQEGLMCKILHMQRYTAIVHFDCGKCNWATGAYVRSVWTGTDNVAVYS